MMNNKGWMLIIESVIAILILFGFVFASIAKQAQEAKALQEKPSLYSTAKILTEKAQENGDIRNAVLQNQPYIVQESLKLNYLSKINPNLDVTVSIANVNQICSTPQTIKSREVYSAESVIATGTSEYEPKKLCVFVYQK